MHSQMNYVHMNKHEYINELEYIYLQLSLEFSDHMGWNATICWHDFDTHNIHHRKRYSKPLLSVLRVNLSSKYEQDSIEMKHLKI